MRISFDLDNTLIPYSDEFEVESSVSILNPFTKEKLRVGTTSLFNELKQDHHEVWIYTTSFRPMWKMQLTFAKYGLYPNGFINQQINQIKLKQHNQTVSKNPRLFDIDLHIDDSEGVRMEGEKYGFDSMIIDPLDENWASKILESVKKRNYKPIR